MSRTLAPRETVVYLLETYPDVLLSERDGVAGATRESRELHLSKMFHEGSYAELERTLKWMRNQGWQKAVDGVALHKLHWHVMEWYIRSERVRREIPKTAKKNGKVVVLRDKDGKPVTTPMMVYRRHPDVRQARVELGVTWLVEHWDEANPEGRRPQLPRELWEVMAA
jgi:hypothetical protein